MPSYFSQTVSLMNHSNGGLSFVLITYTNESFYDESKKIVLLPKLHTVENYQYMLGGNSDVGDIVMLVTSLCW